MLSYVLAGVFTTLAVAYAIATVRRCKRRLEQARATQDTEQDPVERNITARQLELEHGLARRSVLVVGRATLFAGTGCAVWELTGGSTHYLDAATAFGLGFTGWMGVGEAYRRIGLGADMESLLRQLRRARQGVDQSSGTG